MFSEHVKRIEEDLLPRLEQLKRQELRDITVFHGVHGGVATARNLLNVFAGSVAVVDFEAGMVMPTHVHNEKEHFVVMTGKLKIETEKHDCRLEPGDGCELSPGTAHSVSALEPTTVIFIAIPASEGYPGDSGKD